MTSAPDTGPEAPGVTNDDLFLALGNRMRRIVLFHLRQQGAATLSELVDVTREYADPHAEVGADDPDRVAASLAEHHLPLLERLGLVVYDRLHDTVELGSVPDDFGDWIDLATRRELRWGDDRQVSGGLGETGTDTPASASVLVVDDEPGMVDIISKFLERRHDMNTRTATSAPDAFAILEAAPVTCIVSDYRMPAINGVEFLAAVREDYPDIPFILFTNKGSEEVASEAITHDVTPYVPKGSGTEQYDRLAQQIRHAVGGPGEED
jgi:CheY-like chemotaxis protein/DNA-binding transcriptional ArsR family regulator